MSYYLWIPLLITTIIIQSWLSVKSNLGNSHWFWVNYFYVPVVMLVCPLWPLIAKHTKNIVFDGMLFDSIMIVGFAFSLAIFSGKIAQFSVTSWAGITLVMLGLFIFKL